MRLGLRSRKSFLKCFVLYPFDYLTLSLFVFIIFVIAIQITEFDFSKNAMKELD
jgi:hypothetical protein